MFKVEKKLKRLISKEDFDRVLKYIDKDWQDQLDWLMSTCREPSEIINNGFIWDSTEEGWEYWSDMADTLMEIEEELKEPNERAS